MFKAVGKVLLFIFLLLLLPVIGWVLTILGLATPVIAAITIICFIPIVIGIAIGRRSKK